MILMGSLVAVVALFTVWIVRLNKDYKIFLFCKRIKTIDGTPLEKIVGIPYGNPLFGNTFDMLAMDAEQFFCYIRNFYKTLKRSYLLYILGYAIYNIVDADDAELVLNDPKIITKGGLYKFLSPFLKTGLLTSSDKKWHTRRRLLTPAFHFKLLDQFEDIFKQESEKFIKNVNRICDETKDNTISLSELIPRFTLNSICETALGVQLDEMLDGDEYRENIVKVEESVVKRTMNPLLMLDTLYHLRTDGKNYLKYVKDLHKFSSGIIEKRRQLFKIASQNAPAPQQSENQDEFESIYRKQRYAMLDTLLRAEKDGLIDHAGICEEVDTFMFEGFDTTSMNLIFALMNLSLYPEMQKRCYDEINEFIDDDLSRLEPSQLNNLKYVDCFIKETQRLYPSVPIITRECTKDTYLANNLFLPKRTQIAIHIFDIHRNSKYFDKPEEFQPERFYPENSEHRHPFAFIPFSAGQRNCIGQKMALLEVKTLLVYMLKNFELLPMANPESFLFLAGILLRSKTDINIKVKKRI